VAIVGSSFEGQSRFIGASQGVDGLRVASYPGAFTTDTAPVVEEIFTEVVIDTIIDELTIPRAKEDTATARLDPQQIVCKGTLEDIHSFFFDETWSDGLPIIPPTIDRIETFLKFTDRLPHEEIAVVPQAMTRATPWNIAANAVMAGCKPQFMPLLIAVAEAMADPYLNLRDLATTMMLIPYAVINGPIIEQLGIKSDVGAVSRGPNPALGRTIGLLTRNIAGFKPGDNYMATWGYPTLGFAVAEDEENSPWEPFHVEHGFDRSANTVTMGGTMNWGYQTIFGTPEDIEAMGLGLAKHIDSTVYPEINYMEHDQNMVMVFMTAPTAKMFANAGWSKQDLVKFLWENSTITVRELEWCLRHGLRTARKPEQWTMRGVIDSGTYDIPESFAKSEPDDTLPRLISSDEIHIVVTGDRGRDKAQALWSWYNKPTIKEIKLPANWDTLLKGVKK